MTYDDYQKRQWKIDWAEPDALCQPPDDVQFAGPPEQVTVLCRGKATYGEAVYDGKSHTIRRENEYTISMLPGEPLRISFEGKGVIGGSWTAEDHPSPE